MENVCVCIFVCVSERDAVRKGERQSKIAREREQNRWIDRL